MSGWTIGGIVCILYTILVVVVATQKKGMVWKLAKAKLGGDRVTDKTAALIMYIFGALVGVAGIVFLVIGG